jgi:hypothetical protein
MARQHRFNEKAAVTAQKAPTVSSPDLTAHWFETFDRELVPRLGIRATTFRRLFEALLEIKRKDFLIIETGCVRSAENYRGDGQSTALFAGFLECVGGRLITLDIDPAACAYAYSISGHAHEVYCGDSVASLHALAGDGQLRARGADLIYLDAYDVDFQHPHEAALHHQFELCAVMPLCRENTILALDDSPRIAAGYFDDQQRFVIATASGITGKAAYVSKFCERIGLTPLFAAYQVAWRFPPASPNPLARVTSEVPARDPHNNYSPDALNAIRGNEKANHEILANVWRELHAEHQRAHKAEQHAEKQRQRAEAERERAQKEKARADAMTESLSWRLSAPLRAAARRFRRGG